MIRILGTISNERRQAVSEDLRQGTVLGRDYVLMVVFSCAVATFGLALNSGAVIIGAMLISPLMTPILGVALGLVHGEPRSVIRAFGTLALGMLLAVVLSTALGRLVVPFGIDLVEQLPAEMLLRTKPTLFDLAVALAGGAAGSYALAQPRLSATLPGVAIATALMPPVCVVGLGLALGRTDVAGGALLLFAANFVAIVFASSLVFLSLGFAPTAAHPRRGVPPMALLVTGALLVFVAAPLGAFMAGIVVDAQETNLIRTTLKAQLVRVADSSLVGFERNSTGDQQNIVATVRSPRSLTYDEAISMQREVAVQLQKRVALRLLIIP